MNKNMNRKNKIKKPKANSFLDLSGSGRRSYKFGCLIAGKVDNETWLLILKANMCKMSKLDKLVYFFK